MSWFSKKEFVERFSNFDTVEALYLIPVGAIGLFTAYNDWNYLKLIALGYFGHMLFTGVYKFVYNPVKKYVNLHKLASERVSNASSVSTS